MRLPCFLFYCLTTVPLAAQPAPGTFQKQHLFVHVTLGSEFKNTQSGRLLVFVAPGTSAKNEVETDPFHPSQVSVAAKEVLSWAPGTSVDLDADDIVFPAPLSTVAPGDYQLQAVLDVGHTYNYSGRATEDPVSDVVTLKNWNPAQGISQAVVMSYRATKADGGGQGKKPDTGDPSIHEFSFQSRRLAAFWGRDISLRGFVVTPPSYSATTKPTFPVVYFTHGFGGQLRSLKPVATDLYSRMQKKQMPDMIWVLLDESCPTGTHEFADSVNNGPWGEALTTELIPYLERNYRMDAKATGRFLQGHSSGGWATLWLQTRYPKIFGGTWSTSPDPSDFHDFTGVDLYAPHANVYRTTDGTPYPLIRDQGKVMASVEQFAKLEQVIGPYGGQFASFDWVFSPRGQDGRPMPMFDRTTGDVDPAVVEYWRDHYDIAHVVQQNWRTLAPDLRGKIHVIVGTSDTFYLDGAAHKLQAVLDSLNAGAHFTFVPERTHFDLYKVGEDHRGLINQIAAEMYAAARPVKGKSQPLTAAASR